MIEIKINGGSSFLLNAPKIEEQLDLRVIYDFVRNADPLMSNDVYLTCNGRLLNNESTYVGGIIHATSRLPGGKGGFGSMLRAIGAQIEKTTNREACRDLSGRRLRDINEEKRLKKWIAQQADREREAAEKKKKKLEKLCSEPKHEFQDDEYDKVRSEMVEKVHSAVEQGLKASSSVPSEPSTSSSDRRPKDGREKRKGMLWIDEELGTDSSEDDEAAESNCKKQKTV